jgi:DNA-binding PadR family transcriptional regulator
MPFRRARYIGDRYSPSMPKKTTESASRVAGVGFLILTSLADGEKHGYALTQDVLEFAGVRIAPGSLYEALARLEGQGLIEPVASSDRRRPYRLTAIGAGVLDEYLSAQERMAAEARRRLRASWRFA